MSTKRVLTEATMSKAAATDEGGSFYEKEENLEKLCDFLRSKEGPAVREATQMDKRVLYLKGEKLVNFMVEPKMGTKWPKELPRFETRAEAISVCKDLCKYQFIHRSEKRGKGQLAVSRVRDFDESGYFTWIYEGDKTASHMMTALLLVGFLFCTCFPIWPTFLKIFVWYLSVTMLIFIFSLILVRALIFLLVWVLGFDFWILPNLFDESLGFVDSFKPVYSLEPTKPGQLPYRIGTLVAFSSFCYWAVTQPSEFDGFVKGNQDFISDLYAGKLLSDMSQQAKEDIDKPKMQSLDDLLKSLEVEENKQPVDDLDADDEDAVDNMLDNLLDTEDPDIDEDADF